MGLKRNQSYAPGASLYGAMPGDPNMMYPAGAFGYPNQSPPFPVVRLRGLPFDCSENDVVDFFQGLDLIDILFVHKGGRFSGEAFCMLAYPVQVKFLSGISVVTCQFCYSISLVMAHLGL